MLRENSRWKKKKTNNNSIIPLVENGSTES